MNYKPHPFPIEIELEVYREQNGLCCNCGAKLGRIDRPDHTVSQTKVNVKIYGEERIQSKENCQIPCFQCHTNKSLWSKPKIKQLLKKWKPYSKSKLNGTRDHKEVR